MKLPAQVGSSMVMVIDAIGSVNVIVIGWDCPCPSSLWKEPKTSGTTYGSIVQVVGPHVPVAADRGQVSAQSVPHTAARCWTAAAAGRNHGVGLATRAGGGRLPQVDPAAARGLDLPAQEVIDRDGPGLRKAMNRDARH